jgi:predicted RNA-binding protein YlxR (DUF448 family)
MRTCCSCGTKDQLKSLIRLQVDQETQLVRPVFKKKTGRSAWVCVDQMCIQKLLKNPKKFYRSLRMTPSLEGLYDALVDWLYSKVQRNLRTLKRDGVLEHLYQQVLNSDQRLPSKSPQIIIHTHHQRQSTIQLIQVYNELISADKYNKSTRTVEIFEANG